MTQTKNVSRKSFVWGHVGAILFHTLIAILILYVGIESLKTGNVTQSMKLLLVVSGSILLLFSLMSLWPILMKRQYNISGSQQLRQPVRDEN